jgi:uncharacterized protein YdaU (DUF1376 family)
MSGARAGLDHFPFYPDDFSGDAIVEAMTTEEVGAYLLLLCKAWREEPAGSIPDDDRVLARWARLTPTKWRAARPAVLRAFVLGEDKRLHQKRMRAEFARVLEKSAKARASCVQRWKNAEAAAGREPGQPTDVDTNVGTNVGTNAPTDGIRNVANVDTKRRHSEIKNENKDKDPTDLRYPRAAPSTGSIAVWTGLWNEVHGQAGEEPEGLSGTDCKALNANLQRYSQDRRDALIRAYFADRSDFVMAAGHTVGLFVKTLPRYLAQLNGTNGKRSSNRESEWPLIPDIIDGVPVRRDEP